MGPIIGIPIFLLISSNLCFGDGDFVSKEEFNELMRIVNCLKNTVDEGKRKYDDLDRKYKHLEGKFHDVLFELDEIKFQLQSTDQETSEASNIVKKSKVFQKDIARQKRRFHCNSTDHKNRSETIGDRFSQRSKPKTDGSRQRSISSLPRRETGIQQVAFFAREVVDRSDLGLHQTIIFKNVITNIGNNYHQSLGVFICSKPGVYVFFVSTVASPTMTLHTAIVKNGIDISYNFAHGPENIFSQASTMAVIQLNVGDNVWVRNLFARNGKALSDPENSFSGFLLY